MFLNREKRRFPILAFGCFIVQPKGVEAASNTDMGTAGNAIDVTVESEEVALVTQAPLSCPPGGFPSMDST